MRALRQPLSSSAPVGQRQLLKGGDAELPQGGGNSGRVFTCLSLCLISRGRFSVYMADFRLGHPIDHNRFFSVHQDESRWS